MAAADNQNVPHSQSTSNPTQNPHPLQPNLKRLAKALHRDGLNISHQDHTYTLTRLADPQGVSARVLLPDEFPLERKAVEQLMRFASVRHPEGGGVEAAIATPDFHPGPEVPVGAVVATSEDVVIPQAIGTDIQCGMRLHMVDAEIDLEALRKVEPALLQNLRADLLLGHRDLPMTVGAMRAMFCEGLPGWLDAVQAQPLGLMRRADFSQLWSEIERVHRLGSEPGDAQWVPQSLLPTDRDTLRDSDLGTPGGGNHFVELQYVEHVFDRRAAHAMGGVREGQLAVMVHAGSRGVGSHIGRAWMERAKALWPAGLRHPDSGIFCLRGDAAQSYIAAMSAAANYASVNRAILAEMVRLRLRQHLTQTLSMPLLYDAAHNMIFKEGGHLIHRKGATPAHLDQPVLIPGSMGAPSFLMRGLGNPSMLNSASHGAGRAIPRHAMLRMSSNQEPLGLERARCMCINADRAIEEAPAAYKDIQAVIDIQVEAGVVAPVARLRPIVTFKA